MYLNNKFKNKVLIKIFFIIFLIISSINFPASAQEFNSKNIEEIDSLRAELSYCENKNSPQYLKLKQKLDKLISKDNLEYSFENRFDDASRLIQNHQYNAAIFELEDLAQNNFEPSKTNELLGDIYYLTKRPVSKTAQYYKDAIKYDSENISAQYKLAKLYFREKRNILGTENLKEVIQKTSDYNLLSEIQNLILNGVIPNNRYETNELYEALGWVYLKLNQDKSAYNAFQRAIELNPSDIYLKYYLADLYFVKNENKKAIELYSNILLENPNDSQIMLSRAKALEKNNELESAYKQYLEILFQNPSSKSAKYGIYRIYKNTPANNILSKVYPLNPDYKFQKQDYLEFAQILKDKNDIGANKFIEYSKTFDTKPIIKPQINTQTETKAALKDKKEPQKEIQTPKEQLKQQHKKEETPQVKKQQTPQTTKKETKTPPKTINKTQEAKKQEKINEKIAKEELKSTKAPQKDSKKYLELKKAIDKYEAIVPKDKYTYIAIANTYKLMGENKLALENFNNALHLEPTDSDIEYNIGIIYMELNSFETAKIHLEKAINLNPENKKAYSLLAFVNQKLITTIINNAYAKYEAEQYVPAFSILETGIKKFPKSAQLYYYRALVYSRMNRNSAQIADLLKAIELDPTYYMAYYQLGYAYEKIKDERNALMVWERFLSMEPEEKDLIKEIEKKVLDLEKKYY